VLGAPALLIKEYRQRNHRSSYQHENLVEEHLDVKTQICARNKSGQAFGLSRQAAQITAR
jgi:hypothetical protein